jgi:hypothetical protein
MRLRDRLLVVTSTDTPGKFQLEQIYGEPEKTFFGIVHARIAGQRSCHARL